MRRTAALVAALASVSACARPAILVGAPLELTESPAVVRLERPVAATGPSWELCFEFDLPGDSHGAGGIAAVLVAASGQRHPIVDPELDRRGESVVCQRGRIEALDPGETVDAIELTATEPLRLRRIRGGSVL